jgi:hypothetical protein
MIFLGDFEFHDPGGLVHHTAMPKRIQNIEGIFEKFFESGRGQFYEGF